MAARILSDPKAADPLGVVRALYRGIDGFDIPRSEVRAIRAAHSSPVYGELMPSASVQLLSALQLSSNDVFFDLGAGVGKLVVLAALVSKARRVVGVELSESRCAAGRRVLARAHALGLVKRGRVALRQADILATSLADASVLYTCSTAFPYAFTARIVDRLVQRRRPVTFVSTQVLDPQPNVDLRHVSHLDMSWRRRAKVYVYRVNPAGVAASAVPELPPRSRRRR